MNFYAFFAFFLHCFWLICHGNFFIFRKMGWRSFKIFLRICGKTAKMTSFLFIGFSEREVLRRVRIGTGESFRDYFSRSDLIFSFAGLQSPRNKTESLGDTTMAEFEDLNSWLKNFTPRAKHVLALAQKESERLNHDYIGTEHLLLGLISLGEGGCGLRPEGHGTGFEYAPVRGRTPVRHRRTDQTGGACADDRPSEKNHCHVRGRGAGDELQLHRHRAFASGASPRGQQRGGSDFAESEGQCGTRPRGGREGSGSELHSGRIPAGGRRFRTGGRLRAERRGTERLLRTDVSRPFRVRTRSDRNRPQGRA